MTLDGITGSAEQSTEAPIARGLYGNGDVALYDLRDPQPFFNPAIFREVDYLTPSQVIDRYYSLMTDTAFSNWSHVGAATVRTARMAA